MAGVSAGTGAMSSLLGKLAALLGDEYRLLTGVRKQIEFLERELSSMRVLLERLADMEEKLDGMAKDWRGKVRDLSYDIEDCIDRFMDRLGSGDTKPKFMKRTARRLKTLWARHDIATQIKELKARVIEESERRDRYKIDESYYAPTRTVEIDPRISALHEEVRGLVAMDGPMKHITALLTDEKEVELKVVAIVRSGGLGKTTLAMEVYRKIGGDFHCRASVSVSRTLDFEKLLKDIMSQIDKDAYRACHLDRKEELYGRLVTVSKAAAAASPSGARAKETPAPHRSLSSLFKLYVGNLPWEVDGYELKQLFSEYGKVVHAKVVYHQGLGARRSRGFGFVTMAMQEGSEDAIWDLDKQIWRGRMLCVRVARETGTR